MKNNEPIPDTYKIIFTNTLVSYKVIGKPAKNLIWIHKNSPIEIEEREKKITSYYVSLSSI